MLTKAGEARGGRSFRSGEFSESGGILTEDSASGEKHLAALCGVFVFCSFVHSGSVEIIFWRLKVGSIRNRLFKIKFPSIILI